MRVVYSSAEGKERKAADVVIEGISVRISSAASVCLPGNLRVLNGGDLKNSGRTWFFNQLPSELRFDNYTVGGGKFIFSGSADCVLNGRTDFGMVLLEKATGKLILEDEMIIRNSLELKSGLIDATKSRIHVNNSLPGSFLFPNHAANKSYVLGTIIRKVAPNGSYWFPSGNELGFHPFLIQNPSEEEDIALIFDAGISKQWISTIGGAAFTIEDIGGWKVDASGNFSAGLSLLDKEQKILPGNNFSILSAPDESAFASDFVWSKSSIRSEQFYLVGAEKTHAGFYALASEGALRLMNFAFINGAGNHFFEVPEFSKYSQVELTVYNRWGLKIYENPTYNNDFNCADFSQGTYFYELKLHQGESVKHVRNIIEIKRERN